MRFKQFEIGYLGELIGVYYGKTPDEAIAACKEDMARAKFKPDTAVKDRMSGLIAVEMPPKDVDLEVSSFRM
jgi:hypothetical protein